MGFWFIIFVAIIVPVIIDRTSTRTGRSRFSLACMAVAYLFILILAASLFFND